MCFRPADVKAKANICRTCGADNLEYAAICEKCGAELDGPEDAGPAFGMPPVAPKAPDAPKAPGVPRPPMGR